jgi:hypothetical protein
MADLVLAQFARALGIAWLWVGKLSSRAAPLAPPTSGVAGARKTDEHKAKRAERAAEAPQAASPPRRRQVLSLLGDRPENAASPDTQPRQIEIWFTEHGGRFYLIAERESANWVRNIQSRSGSATLNSTPSHVSCRMTASLSSRRL